MPALARSLHRGFLMQSFRIWFFPFQPCAFCQIIRDVILSAAIFVVGWGLSILGHVERHDSSAHCSTPSRWAFSEFSGHHRAFSLVRSYAAGCERVNGPLVLPGLHLFPISPCLRSPRQTPSNAIHFRTPYMTVPIGTPPPRDLLPLLRLLSARNRKDSSLSSLRPSILPTVKFRLPNSQMERRRPPHCANLVINPAFSERLTTSIWVPIVSRSLLRSPSQVQMSASSKCAGPLFALGILLPLSTLLRPP